MDSKVYSRPISLETSRGPTIAPAPLITVPLRLHHGHAGCMSKHILLLPQLAATSMLVKPIGK